VLIVDDNTDAANSLAMLLQLDGHEVQAVYNSREALERALSFRPDVMLLDIGLPGMNGYEMAQTVRMMPGLGSVRLIAVTGYGRSEDRGRALAAGFDDHLVKPVEANELKRSLASSVILHERRVSADS
jgi:CheY-like chemotaxis protein